MVMIKKAILIFSMVSALIMALPFSSAVAKSPANTSAEYIAEFWKHIDDVDEKRKVAEVLDKNIKLYARVPLGIGVTSAGEFIIEYKYKDGILQKGIVRYDLEGLSETSNSKFLVKALAFSTSPSTSLSPSPDPASEAALKTVQEYIDSINNKNWESLIRSMTKETHGLYHEYFNDKENEKESLGYFNVISSRLKGIKSIPVSEAMRYTPRKVYEGEYSSYAAYLAGINYEVKKENFIYYNGVNYEMFVLGEKGGKWYLLIDMMAPLESLIPRGYGFNSEDEKRAYDNLKGKTEGQNCEY